MKKEQKDFIFHDLASSVGSEESSKIYTITTIRTGETRVVIEKSIRESFPIQDLEKAQDLYERLNCGSGRKVWKLEEIAHPYNPN